MKTKFNMNVIIIVIGVIAIMGILGLVASNKLREINEEKSYSVKQINGIQVDIGPQNVHFIESKESSEVKLHLSGKAMHKLKIVSEINNKTLCVKLQRGSMPLFEKVVLDIYVPKEYGKNVSINMSTGAVKMDSFDLANFTYNTSTGKLEVEKINAEKVSINTSTGGVNIKKLRAKELKIKGKTSAINIDECIVKSGVVETSTGSVTLKNSSGTLDVKGGSGKVLVVYKEFEDQNITIENTTGSVTLELPNTAEFLVEAKTSTGNIHTDFPVETTRNTDKKQILGEVGTKSNKVSLQTSSGSIKILKK